ncbi:ribonuclease J [Sporobacter termitidis DSM 10068]|uniref:Ribonuclease J n=1 Tax=Sporobacter termitidis DSM 10068 TaxID=1123282 RepID=A0A1M5Y3G0_9FIRM|nr:ribonuclease J [Sporobacter termitidis]SHI06043.1 ribonuclease J [Sporobacter termitidis DSM 10068]
MAEKLKIISLGGLNEIGKNLTVYEFGGDILVVDCGLGFPDDEMYGVDIVIPDFTYLVKNKNKVRAIVLTHGHEDHIGGMPYILKELNVPVYATPLTAGLVQLKLAEHGLLETSTINTLNPGESFKVGCFKVEFVHINHSIPGAVALAIKTPVGMIVHTGDYKIDTTPISGSMIDLARLGELGNRGVLALLQDSTNVERPGYSMSERKVGERFDELFRGCTSRILVTTFASNVHRIQQIINCAAKYGRRVAVTGRSMENIIKVATELGCMEIPKGVFMELNQIKGMPAEKIVIITTGSQGETMSALYRMAFSDHRQVEIKPGDKVIISASAIPGNEKGVSRVIDELFRRGAEVFYDKYSDLHVSGHAYQEELKMMMALTKPKFFIPLHGEYRHLMTHSKLALQMGIEPKNIVISDIGQVIELTGRSIKRNGSVPSGKVFVDGTGVGDVGAVVLRDRKHLAQDGMLVIIVNISSEDGSLVSGPDIITRGFIYVKESEDMMRELKDITIKALGGCAGSNITDFATMKSAVKSELSNYLYKKTKRNPMILPVITEI